jgi:glycosyltransferase involved in cell wall biosynthesis
MPNIDLSLIICTRNRAQALRRCLAAVLESDLFSFRAELVVVDNGSSDETPGVLQELARARNLATRAVCEPNVGLSKARNAGMKAAQGAILAFTDDDCYVAGDFGAALLRAFADNNFDYCGGRILLFDSTDAEYACNIKDSFELIPARSFVYAGRVQGANMAFRREVVEVVGPFDPGLGAGTRFRCEDADYVARASSAGFVGAHVPELVVYHHHGRRPGSDIEELGAANDFARGAYYMKLLLNGQLTVLPNWLRITRRSQHWAVPHRFSQELRGAVAYVADRAVSRRA